MEAVTIIEHSIYFLALLNPASKILFLTGYTPPLSFKELFEMSWKSSLAALAMLLCFVFIGKFVLNVVFRVDIYSLKIVGGLVLFFIGWTAIRKGMFFQTDEHKVHESLSEVSIVPLAAPLIAGPGTITASISFAAEFGIPTCLSALGIALLLNFVLMLFSVEIGRLMRFLCMTGPLIRITGLIVATVSMQMMLSGVGEWLKSMP